MCAHGGGNTAVWGNVRGRRRRQEHLGQHEMGAIAKEGQDGETPHLWDAAAGRSAGGCCDLGGQHEARRGVGPGAAGVPGVRVEMPKCFSILQARYEMCVMYFGSSECLLS